ncbi:MAG: diacylglycerol kinase family lipid kinase [Oscillospiraceae bacterium]|nr:diacylglycerol kinase family lipid kinase [Oscillospiraceae bacterium]
MERKLLMIVNPAAGRGVYKLNFADALQTLDTGGLRITVAFTRGPKDATRIARESGSAHDIVACIGGDGTLSEVMAGLMQLQDPPPLGYLPMGTSNDVATSLGIPKNDPVGAAQRILQGKPRPFDVGGFGDDGYFAYIAAFGAFTQVSYATPQAQKKALGHLAYVLQGAAALPYIETYRTRVEYDGGTIEADLVYGSMSNSTSVAGIVRLPEAMVSLGDGFSELVLVKDPGNLKALSELADSVLSQRFDSDKLIILHTKKARFVFEKPVPWTRDGEDGGPHRELELRNYHAPVKLIF